ncbi:type II secretion system F family protein [Rothia sp. P6271]|uniref:type II secretion system F family protein n=1 Tax=unclassified Rothia (in: high G+C Gram-positive bacteria) TaxID=2689056 RepID=UPI003AC92C08
MNIILGLTLGIGVFLIWLSCWEQPAKEPRKNTFDSKIRLLLHQADVHRVSAKMFYLISICFALFLGLVIFALTALYNLALLSTCLGCIAPWMMIRQRAKKRVALMRELWPDVVDHLRSAIRAGLSLPEALMQLQYRGPEELRPAFEQFSADYRSTGEFVASLNRLKERLSDPTADNIVEALKVTREVGGTDLSKLLGTLSEFLRENARTRSELEARQSWTINAAKLAVAAPWVVLCLMATQPGTVHIYNSFSGFMVMLSGLIISIIAYRLMLKLGELPEEKRVLV